MPFATAKDGTNLYYSDWGSGPAAVLIHGWPLSSDMWEYQRPFLGAHGVRTIAYDRRGFGKSDQPWGGYDYDTFTDDLQTVLDACGAQDVTLVGFSMGGGEVARYLTKYGRGRVAKAVLLASVVPFLLKTDDNPDGAPQNVFDEMVDGLNKDRAHFLAGFGKDKFMAAGLMHAKASPEGLLQTQQIALMASPKATIDCVRAFSATDFRPDLPSFAGVPTLIIHGNHDQTVPHTLTAKKAHEAIPGSTYSEYDGAPHGLFVTDKDKLNAELLAFIQS